MSRWLDEVGQWVGRERTYDWYYFILDGFGGWYDVEEAGEVELRDG